MTRMLLTRHAESEWNVLGRWQGHADPPLSDRGRRQAGDASASVGAVDAIAASTLRRARHTADIIAEAIGVGPVLDAPGLIERDAGEWSGLTRAEIERDYPGYLSASRFPPGFEVASEFLSRVLSSLARLRAIVDGQGDVLVVTHAGVIYAVEAHLGLEFERIPNLGARWIHFEDDRLELGPRVLLIDEGSVTVQAPETL